jgi:hypothetical protein
MNNAARLEAYRADGVDAESFEELAAIAVAELRKRNELVDMVCGPITTGGTGNPSYNFDIFNATIEGLTRLGHTLFDQRPYEFGLNKLVRQWQEAGNNGYCLPIFDTFYTAVLDQRFIARAWFIPRWQTSTGAKLEYKRFRELEIDMEFLTPEIIHRFLLMAYPLEHATKIMRTF